MIHSRQSIHLNKLSDIQSTVTTRTCFFIAPFSYFSFCAVLVSVYSLWSPAGMIPGKYFLIRNLKIFEVFGLVPESPSSVAVATFIQSLAPLNSAANPLIYCLFSADTGKLLRYETSSPKIFDIKPDEKYFSPCYKVLPCLRLDPSETGVTSTGQTNSSQLTTSSSGSSQHRNKVKWVVITKHFYPVRLTKWSVSWLLLLEI